jgi:hypothetical protein
MTGQNGKSISQPHLYRPHANSITLLELQGTPHSRLFLQKVSSDLSMSGVSLWQEDSMGVQGGKCVGKPSHDQTQH